MDSSSLMIGIVVLLFVGGLWLWKYRTDSVQRWRENVSANIRSKIGAGSQKELMRLDQHVKSLEQTLEGRVRALESEALLSHQLQEHSRIIDRRLEQLEHSEPSYHEGHIEEGSRPRSIIRHGLRFTLSDILWSYVGVKTMQDIGEGQVLSLIQGPFCRMCLKKMVSRHRGQTDTAIPRQCRFCGVPWNYPDSEDIPPTEARLKGEVYEYLDRQRRVLRNAQRDKLV